MRKQEAPMKLETSISNINNADIAKPSRLNFATIKKNRKTE